MKKKGRPSAKLEGSKVGRLTVLSYHGTTGKSSLWNCKCECGNEVVRSSSNLARDAHQSCGCYVAIKHGHTARGSMTSEYNSWRAMIARCSNRKNNRYPMYGGRGITVCDQWKTFGGFIADMGRKPTPRHSIDRKNRNGNYEPSNCKWVDGVVQANNKSDNFLISHNGLSLTLAQWSRKTGIGPSTIRARILSGVSPERALTTPPRASKLAPAQKDQAFRIYKAGGVSMVKVGKMFSVSKTTIGQAIREFYAIVDSTTDAK